MSEFVALLIFIIGMNANQINKSDFIDLWLYELAVYYTILTIHRIYLIHILCCKNIKNKN